MSDTGFPERKHLRRLEQIFAFTEPAIFYVTIRAYMKRKNLTDDRIADEIENTFIRSAEIHGWAVGRYVIMPDHVHFFCAPVRHEKNLSEYVRDVKRWTTRAFQKQGLRTHPWQREYFDHLLRGNESYEAKWEYARNNPVRVGLCGAAEEWPFQGECEKLQK